MILLKLYIPGVCFIDEADYITFKSVLERYGMHPNSVCPVNIDSSSTYTVPQIRNLIKLHGGALFFPLVKSYMFNPEILA